MDLNVHQCFDLYSRDITFGKIVRFDQYVDRATLNAIIGT